MPLQLSLAVLSACETATGRELPGEGLDALTRSFLLAGSTAVAGSLWKVQDAASADLMIAFHRGLRNRLPASEALRQAQLLIMSQPGKAHPYYWGAFQLSGADVELSMSFN
jgi:CHAT domain-containing protein